MVIKEKRHALTEETRSNKALATNECMYLSYNNCPLSVASEEREC